MQHEREFNLHKHGPEHLEIRLDIIVERAERDAEEVLLKMFLNNRSRKIPPRSDYLTISNELTPGLMECAITAGLDFNMNDEEFELYIKRYKATLSMGYPKEIH